MIENNIAKDLNKQADCLQPIYVGNITAKAFRANGIFIR
jgi:hypothetical protein